MKSKIEGAYEECQGLKEEYEKCFQPWLKRFINNETKEFECSALFEEYKKCFYKNAAINELDVFFANNCEEE